MSFANTLGSKHTLLVQPLHIELIPLAKQINMKPFTLRASQKPAPLLGSVCNTECRSLPTTIIQ